MFIELTKQENLESLEIGTNLWCSTSKGGSWQVKLNLNFVMFFLEQTSKFKLTPRVSKSIMP